MLQSMLYNNKSEGRKSKRSQRSHDAQLQQITPVVSEKLQPSEDSPALQQINPHESLLPHVLVQTGCVLASFSKRLFDTRTLPVMGDVERLLRVRERGVEGPVNRLEDITAGDAVEILDDNVPVRQPGAPDRHPRELQTLRCRLAEISRAKREGHPVGIFTYLGHRQCDVET